jgi:hypothetical protein
MLAVQPRGPGLDRLIVELDVGTEGDFLLLSVSVCHAFFIKQERGDHENLDRWHDQTSPAVRASPLWASMRARLLECLSDGGIVDTGHKENGEQDSGLHPVQRAGADDAMTNQVEFASRRVIGAT